jgi:hypothetical protein
MSHLLKIEGRRGGREGHLSEKPDISSLWKCGPAIAFLAAMSSSLDPIYKKMASSPESVGAGYAPEVKFDPVRQISPVVAHELNNLLTIIQGYTDRLLLKHGDNPALQAHLKLISEASRRAATLVRSAVPPKTDISPRPQPNPPLPVAAA